MTSLPELNKISVIVPTIGRPDSLRRLLISLCRQTSKVHEVIIADGSDSGDTKALVASAEWKTQGLHIRRVPVQPPNAVRQRVAAITQANGEYLLLLDDDVELEADCVEHMLQLLSSDVGIVGVFGDFNNQTWSKPTWAWRFYMRYFLQMEEGTWQGRVVGPLLRFGYNPPPFEPMPMEWLGTCNTMIRRSAYEQVGGFSNFFLHRCTMNEDVDLGVKISRLGRILFCPAARMGHFHAPGGRVAPMKVAEDDVFNRFLVMHRTQEIPAAKAFSLTVLYVFVETASNVGGCLRRFKTNGLGARTLGRFRALFRVLSWLSFRNSNA